jgi:hypothetical protein
MDETVRQKAPRVPFMMAVLSSLAFAAFVLSVPHVAPRQASNTTLYYTVLEGDSIFSIAAKLSPESAISRAPIG